MENKNKTPKDIRLLEYIAAGFLALAVLVMLLHKKQQTKFEYLREETKYGTFEENLNKAISETLLKGETPDTLLYCGLYNHVIDTAWIVPKGEGYEIFNILNNKKKIILTKIDASEQESKEDIDELIKIDQQLTTVKKRFGIRYGWRLVHGCYLNGKRSEIIIEADSTGTIIEEVYGDRYNFKACKDSAKIQNILRQKIR